MPLTELQLYINNIARCLVIVVFYMQGYNIVISTLSSSVLLSYKSILYNHSTSLCTSENITSPTQYLFLIVSTSTNTFRPYHLHWNHNTCSFSFKLILCEQHWIYHYNQRLNQHDPAHNIHFFYMRSHLSALQNCAFLISTNFQFNFTFKNALHNLDIELCSALNIFQKYFTVIY